MELNLYVYIFFLKYDEIQIILIILNNINAVKITLSFNFFINNFIYYLK